MFTLSSLATEGSPLLSELRIDFSVFTPILIYLVRPVRRKVYHAELNRNYWLAKSEASTIKPLILVSIPSASTMRSFVNHHQSHIRLFPLKTISTRNSTSARAQPGLTSSATRPKPTSHPTSIPPTTSTRTSPPPSSAAM